MKKPTITMMDGNGNLRHYNYCDGMLQEQVASLTDPYGGIVEYQVQPTGDKPDTGNAYTDRLYQWDSAKYNRCCREVWGNEAQLWDYRSAKEIEKFLRGYTGRECRLLQKVRYTNQASGWPVWRLDWQYMSA